MAESEGSRRCPPPRSVDDPDMKLSQDCFIVHDANGQALACVYFEDEPGRRRSFSPATTPSLRLPMRVTMHGHGECLVKINVHKIWGIPLDAAPAIGDPIGRSAPTSAALVGRSAGAVNAVRRMGRASEKDRHD